MTSLKAKLSAFEGYVAMQILSQDESLRNTDIGDSLRYTASNGVVVVSAGGPYISINHRSNSIEVGIRGFDKSTDYSVAMIQVPHGKDSSEYINLITFALNEYITNITTEDNSINNFKFSEIGFNIVKFNNSLVIEAIRLPESYTTVQTPSMVLEVNADKRRSDLYGSQYRFSFDNNFDTPYLVTFEDNGVRDDFYVQLREAVKEMNSKLIKSKQSVIQKIEPLGTILINI